MAMVFSLNSQARGPLLKVIPSRFFEVIGAEPIVLMLLLVVLHNTYGIALRDGGATATLRLQPSVANLELHHGMPLY